MKKKKIILSIIGLILVGGISVSIIHQQNVKGERVKQEEKSEVKNTVKENQEDPYQNIAKDKAVQVMAVDKAVSDAVKAKEDKKAQDEVNKKVTDAENEIGKLKGDDADTKSIREAYTDVVNVVKNPSIDNIQKARTSIANMKDSALAQHMEQSYEKPMANVVATVVNKTPKEVLNASKPLTAQQQKAKQDAANKAKADAEAKAKADAKAKAEAKAKADADAKAKADAQAQQAQQAPAQQAPAQQAPAQQAPAQQAAQDAQNNTNNNNGIMGNEAPNGGQMETPGWGF